MRPLVVVHGTRDALAARAVELRAAGWNVRRSWRLTSRVWNAEPLRIVCAGVLRGPRDAEAAVLAAARGAGVLVAVGGADPILVERLYEDLSRFGPVDVERSESSSGRPLIPRLGVEESRLLAMLAAGMSVADASRTLFISRRTADRRLAAARITLGVRTTAEAVVAWSRAGEAS